MIARPFYNILDAVQAPARGLSAKQIFLLTFALVAGLLVFDIFRYLAYLEQGENLGLVFDLYGFFPFDSPPHGRVLAQILFGTGIAGSVLCIMCGLLAVSIIHVEAIRGNAFLTARNALRFTRSRLRQLIASESAIVIFVGFIVLLFTLWGLIARIPVLGDLLFSIFFVIPGFVIALFTVFILFALALSVILLPAVAATERAGESFGVILETFSTIIRQPSRWIGYTAVAAVLSKVASFVYAYFAYRAIQFIVAASSVGGGEKIDRLVGSAAALLPLDSKLAQHVCNILPGIRWSFDIRSLSSGAGGGIATHLLSLMLFLIFASIVAYFLTSLAAAQVYTYVGMRKLRDSHDLTSEKPLFSQDELAENSADSETAANK